MNTVNTALLLVQIQNDFFANGKAPLDDSFKSSLNAQKLLHAYRESRLPVIHIQHISTHPDATFLLPCTKGAEFQSNVQPIKGEMIIKKHYPNSFKDTQLLNYLNKNKINHLLICGMTTHLAIDATVRAAHDFNFTCTVVPDACAASQLTFNHVTIPAQHVHYAFLAALHTNYATTMNTEDCLQKMGIKVAIPA